MNLLWREALLSFRRNRTLSALSITTIAFALFVTGLFGLVALNMQAAIVQVAERVEVVAFVARGTPSEELTVAASDIQAFPEVLAVTYVSEDSALAKARAELVEFRDAFQDLEINPLPPSLEVRLRPEFRTAKHAGEVAERLRALPFVEDVRFGQGWVERLDSLRTIAGLVGFAIGLAFALVSVVIIGVAIRLTVLQRAREIHIMRLVGATDWFIRGPFLLEGAIKGLAGGIVATVLCFVVLSAIQAQGISLGMGVRFFDAAEVLFLLLFGLLLGFGGALLSVGRQLRKV
jgi:cell division transport system permease protein